MLSAIILSFISTHQGTRSSASIEPTKASSVTNMSRNERELPQRMPGSDEDWSPAGACRVSADKQQQTVWTSQAVCHSHWGQARIVQGHIGETRCLEAERQPQNKPEVVKSLCSSGSWQLLQYKGS